MPKTSADQEKPQLVTHLVRASAELEHLYHNRALHSLHSSIETLFARFAWTIFPLLNAFITCRARRRLLVANENVTFLNSDVFVPWERCAQFSTKRSQSPKKRRPEAEPAMDENIGISAMEGPHRRKRHQRRYALSSHDLLDLSSHPLDHHWDSFASSIPASPTSLPAPDANASLWAADSDDVTHESQSSPSASFNDAHDHSNISTLSHTWLEQERQRSNTQNEWEEKKAWAKEVWNEYVMLDEEKAKK